MPCLRRVANLAVTIARGGAETLLVDGNLRQPSIHSLFQLNKTPGLTDILESKLEWTEALNNAVVENLSVIAGGSPSASPCELLGSRAMENLLTELESRFDIILFDAPPIIRVTDAAVLGAKLDGVLLTVRAGKTQREAVVRAQSLLTGAGTKLLGFILTGVQSYMPEWLKRHI